MSANTYYSHEEVYALINKAGAKHQPCFFILDYDGREGVFVADPMVQDLSKLGLAFKVGAYSSDYSWLSASNVPPRIEQIYPETEARYAERFNVIHSGLSHGDSFLTNLTLRTPITLSTSSLADVYRHTQARYQILLNNRFVCYSPETFVRIEGTTISTYPMKGTISAEIEGADEILLNDYKESCEHATIVDLMRNDLNRVASDVRVKRFKYLDLLTTSKGNIWQMSSEVVGSLSSDWHSSLGDILAKLLPAGSISGAPKERTCELIAEAEGCPRAYYTGICGYYDGEGLDSGVLIRFIEQEGNEFFYRSGGGITINSKMAEEYRECIQKIYLPLKGS